MDIPYYILDSGPCDELWNRVGKCKLAVVEMGVPQWVATEFHHKPMDIQKLAEENPQTTLLITHTYIDTDYEIITTQWPDLPSNVIAGIDNLQLEVQQDSVKLILKQG